MRASQSLRHMCSLVEHALEDQAEEEVELTMDCNEQELLWLIEFCEHHNFQKTSSEIKQPLVSKDPQVWCQDQWDRDWIGRFDIDQRCQIMETANTFGCIALMDLAAASIASEFKMKDFE